MVFGNKWEMLKVGYEVDMTKELLDYEAKVNKIFRDHQELRVDPPVVDFTTREDVSEILEQFSAKKLRFHAEQVMKFKDEKAETIYAGEWNRWKIEVRREVKRRKNKLPRKWVEYKSDK